MTKSCSVNGDIERLKREIAEDRELRVREILQIELQYCRTPKGASNQIGHGVPPFRGWTKAGSSGSVFLITISRDD